MCRGVRDPVIYTAIGRCVLLSPFLDHAPGALRNPVKGPYSSPRRLGSAHAVDEILGPLGLYVQRGTRPSYLYGYRQMHASITISGPCPAALRNPVEGPYSSPRQ